MHELAAILAALLWATASLIYARIHHIHFIILNAVQCLVAVPFLWFTACFFPFGAIGAEELLLFLLSSLIGIVLADSGYFLSIKNLGASNTLLFFPLVPVFTLIFEIIFLGSSITMPQVAGMIVVLVGLVLYCISNHKKEQLGEVWLGIVGGLLYASAAAISEVIVKSLIESYNPFFVSAVRASIASAVLLPMGLKVGNWPQGKNLFLVALAGFLGIFIGILLSAYAISGLPAAVSTTLLSTTVIFGMVLGLLAGDKKSIGSWVGSLVVVVGVGIIAS